MFPSFLGGACRGRGSRLRHFTERRRQTTPAVIHGTMSWFNAREEISMSNWPPVLKYRAVAISRFQLPDVSPERKINEITVSFYDAMTNVRWPQATSWKELPDADGPRLAPGWPGDLFRSYCNHRGNYGALPHNDTAAVTNGAYLYRADGVYTREKGSGQRSENAVSHVLHGDDDFKLGSLGRQLNTPCDLTSGLETGTNVGIPGWRKVRVLQSMAE
ncbi:hypothetical protein PAXINDRAFT_182627 [Paxillus involutus ATCC 200175]|uniref:Uncharacterized protein n=1 Tax=Paxillus involutus ATCC 200175 TaxID=664439 RepID=A0A0C9T628_PAXIN|nr:hypothetical protein PAXINDRAFT_182627 [Paxillus involutus ATCC 200175]